VDAGTVDLDGCLVQETFSVEDADVLDDRGQG